MDPNSSKYKGSRGTPVSWHYVPQKRRLLPEDPFYEDGNIWCSIEHKHMPVEVEKPADLLLAEFSCHVSGCPAGSFTTVQDYEIHYNSTHRFVCSACSRVFPSAHLLDIHVTEWHDALFQVLAQKQPMFLCLVQGCGVKFVTAEERKQHLVKEHQYPKDFRFDRRAKTKRNLSAQPQIQDTQQQDDSMDIGVASTESQHSIDDTVITSANRQYRVPKNICFGRGGARTFERLRTKPQHGKKGNATKESNITTTEEHCAILNTSQSQMLPVSHERSDLQNNTHHQQIGIAPGNTESEVSMDTR